MKRLWEAIKRGYLRVIEPAADMLVRSGVSPNAITVVGTLCSVTGGVIYATGHIRTAGWFLGLTALFDVLDGTVARRTGRCSTFGAFFDSTLDRIADGAVLGGLAVFYAREAVRVASEVPTGPGLFAWLSPVDKNVAMMVVCLVGIIGTFLVSYTRARAEALGIDAKVGVMQRPERVTLLSAPQAFFGLALYGWVLMAIVALLATTAWWTAFQRIAFVHRRTSVAPRRALASATGASADAPPVRADAPPPPATAAAATAVPAVARRPRGNPPSSSPAAPRL